MIYQAYEAFEMMAAPLRRFAEEAADHFSQPWSGMHAGNWPPAGLPPLRCWRKPD